MDLQSRTESNPPYLIRESEEYAEQFRHLVPSARLRDEIQRVFYAELPADPEKFERIPGTRLRAVTVATTPPLTLYFTVENRVITLLEIHPLT